MIIQCKQCRTKFRFDESQMEGDGVWMRCGRCQHVFFHDNPLNLAKPSASTPAAPSDFREPPSSKTDGPLSFEPAGPGKAASPADEDVESFLQDVIAPEAPPREQAAPAAPAGLSPEDIEFSPGAPDADEEELMEEPVEDQPAHPVRRKRKWLSVILWIWSILIIIVAPAVLMYFLYPQQLDRYVQLGRKYIHASPASEGQSVVMQVQLQDIRQRVVSNYLLGVVRIVEGSVVNRADYAVARIQVKAELMDAYSVILDQRVSYAGNVLSDEDLANLSEEEMAKRLALPEGRDDSNDRVVPNGRIPFMIVFTRDQPSAIKTTVSIAGAEKLL